jgi:DNA-binding MarR family transcriptional regulator
MRKIIGESATDIHPQNTRVMNTDDLYRRPGFLLRRAHQISASIFERACAELALTPAQYGVLRVLQERPGIDQSSLARALAFDKVTVLRVIQGLEERGLCQRAVAIDNRRQMAVRLTPAGAALLRQAIEPVQQAYETLMSPFTDEHRQQFMDLLMRLNTELDTAARASFVPMVPVPDRAKGSSGRRR